MPYKSASRSIVQHIGNIKLTSFWPCSKCSISATLCSNSPTLFCIFTTKFSMVKVWCRFRAWKLQIIRPKQDNVIGITMFSIKTVKTRSELELNEAKEGRKGCASWEANQRPIDRAKTEERPQNSRKFSKFPRKNDTTPIPLSKNAIENNKQVSEMQPKRNERKSSELNKRRKNRSISLSEMEKSQRIEKRQSNLTKKFLKKTEKKQRFSTLWKAKERECHFLREGEFFQVWGGTCPFSFLFS